MPIKEIAEAADVQKLFAKTNIRELQKVFVFANALYEALWEMLTNGRKPVLRPMRYSVNKMKRNRKKPRRNQTVQEMIVQEVQDFFESILSKGLTKHSSV